MEVVGSSVLPFLAILEWMYIITFILICYIFQSAEKQFNWVVLIKFKTRFKVAIIGLLYAPIYYFLWGLDKDQIGILFSSFLVSFAFHKLLIDSIIGAIKAKLSKLNISQKQGGLL